MFVSESYKNLENAKVMSICDYRSYIWFSENEYKEEKMLKKYFLFDGIMKNIKEN